MILGKREQTALTVGVGRQRLERMREPRARAAFGDHRPCDKLCDILIFHAIDDRPDDAGLVASVGEQPDHLIW